MQAGYFDTFFFYSPQQKWRNQLLAYGSISTPLNFLMRVEWDGGSIICNYVSEEILIFERGWLDHDPHGRSCLQKITFPSTLPPPSLHYLWKEVLSQYAYHLWVLTKYKNSRLISYTNTDILWPVRVSASCFLTGHKQGAEGFLQV